MAYSNELKALLSAGKGVGVIANLVDDTGASNLPNGSKTTFKLSKKFTSTPQVLKSTDSGVTWAVQTVTFNSVANTITFSTAPASTDLIMVSGGTGNQAAIPITTPKPIEYVDRDLIASNHHSVYAYNGLTYAGTGKVATGSSVESKGVEDVVGTTKVVEVGVQITVNQGEIVVAGEGHTDAGIYYKRLNSDATFTSSGGTLASSNWEEVTRGFDYNSTTPIHNTITLDNQSIVGVKGLVARTSDATQVFTQEIIDGQPDSGEFEQLTNGVLDTGEQTKVLLKPSSVRI